MNSRHLTLGIGMVLLLAWGSNSAETKSKNLSCTFGATFVSPGIETHIDTNGDGMSAGVHQGLVNCNIGRFFFQEEFEFQFAGTTSDTCPTACPAGTTELDLVQAHGVLTAEKTSEQLFFEDAACASEFCLNPDLTFSFAEHATFTGGTGPFTEASGSFDGQGSGKYLVFAIKQGLPPVGGPGGFGQFTETATGTLDIPK